MHPTASFRLCPSVTNGVIAQRALHHTSPPQQVPPGLRTPLSLTHLTSYRGLITTKELRGRDLYPTHHQLVFDVGVGFMASLDLRLQISHIIS